jgi:hypothetical protein
MITNNFLKSLAAAAIIAGVGVSCSKLESKVYSVVPNSEFWSTPAQVAAGVAPAYTALQGIPSGSLAELNEASSDEMIIPVRGADWLDGNEHTQEWLHTWDKNHGNVSGTWSTIFNGIGQANFTLSIVNGLATPPSNLAAINAEVHVLRDYFYFLALDNFGNVPYVTSFNVDPSTVKQIPPAALYDSIVADLTANVPLLAANVDATTYGRITKWAGYAILAKLYMGAQVYTGTADWADAITACNQIINSGNYSLLNDYFDNFSPTNSSLVGSGHENIFVIPFDKVNIGGQNWEMETLHYQNNINFALSGSPWNGFSTAADFYYKFDTSSIYTTKGAITYRTFNDQRTGQYLVGQQYNIVYSYPPSTNVVVNAPAADIINDAQFGIPLIFSPDVNVLSDPAGSFRGAGVRNIKYFPEAGTSGNQSNDAVVFRYADILLMKAEAEMRSGTNLDDALSLVNQVRTRAYGSSANNWTASQLTLPNLLAERGRELAWETYRRDDLIRFEVADGIPYWSGPRNPGKTADPGTYTRIFPIPANQISANPNLVQNTGY